MEPIEKHQNPAIQTTTASNTDNSVAAVAIEIVAKLPELENNNHGRSSIQPKRSRLRALYCIPFLLCFVIIICVIIVVVSYVNSPRAKSCTQYESEAFNSLPTSTVSLNISFVILKSAICSDLNGAGVVTANDVKRWVRYSQVQTFDNMGINLLTRSIQVLEVNATQAKTYKDLSRSSTGTQWFKNVGVLEPLRPQHSFSPTGLTGYIIADAPLCGLALTGSKIGRGSFFIRGKPCVHTDLSDDDVRGVILSHEIGHILSLRHNRKDCNFMDYKRPGFWFSLKQALDARMYARTGRGYVKKYTNSSTNWMDAEDEETVGKRRLDQQMLRDNI
jgi:hypothetical protein